MLDQRLENVAIIGAAGKMGSGISVLIASEIAKLQIKPENKDKVYRLSLIDVNEKALDGLRQYLKAQLTKIAEKSIVQLRSLYEYREDLIENWEIINAFVDEALGCIRMGTELELARNANLIFEAIIEDEDTKINLLKTLDAMCKKDTFFLTNTSSIPIGLLDEKAGLSGRIIGFHFYNPPVVQKLVELISAKTTRQELKELANELGKRLGKKLVPANDISGFIGNGHFIRDGLYAISEVERLKGEFSLPKAIYIMDRIARDFLIRPMGIFQLIDYVGIDVFNCILKVMRKHLGDPALESELINKFVEKKVLGGQRADGSQKDGFFKYEKNRPVAVYDIEKGEYIKIEEWQAEIDEKIGNPPEGFSPWKTLLRDPKRETKLRDYFNNLKEAKTFGAELARNYLRKTKEIALQLVEQGVANSEEDVNAVLTNGFYWLYGPINDYI